MTTDELRRVASALVPPVGATGVCAVVDDGAYRAAWVIEGRRKVPVGPRFEKPRDAYRFVDVLAGDR